MSRHFEAGGPGNLGEGEDNREIAYNCRHFRNDRPCRFHKEQGFLCSSCPHRDLIGERILLVKLEAPGDVLRTTCLLTSLKKVYPSSQITWVTGEASRPLLLNNPAIDRLVHRWEEVFAILQTEDFDVAINPDTDPQAARILQMARAQSKFGMGWSAAGRVRTLNPEAEAWLKLGLFDDLKRQNRDSYQILIHRLCGLPLEDPRPQLHLTPGEQEWAREYLQSLGLDRERPVLGINTGAGGRWPRKSWPVAQQAELIHLAKRLHPDWQILLLGGPAEVKAKRFLEQSCPGLVYNGGCHPVRKFAGLVSLVDILLTPDTLAIHIGLALGRRLVALFGPTSHAEIDLCGLGEKLFADLDCLGCYRTACDRSPGCMDLLAPEDVLAALERGLQERSSEVTGHRGGRD